MSKMTPKMVKIGQNRCHSSRPFLDPSDSWTTFSPKMASQLILNQIETFSRKSQKWLFNGPLPQNRCFFWKKTVQKIRVFSPRPRFQEHLHKESGYEPWIQGLGDGPKWPIFDHFLDHFLTGFGSEYGWNRYQNGPKPVKNGSKMGQKWVKNGSKMGQKWVILGHLFWPVLAILIPIPAIFWSKTGQKVVQKVVKNGSFWAIPQTLDPWLISRFLM